MFIISDISVKNNIATSISHIWREHDIIMKTIHYTIKILFTETKLFTIRCGISQVTQIQGITQIIIVINVIPVAKTIFDTSYYSY